MSKVRVLYDFEGEGNSSEMTIRVGDILMVANTNVGDGWWEGTNARGERGLFPAAYVEALPAFENKPPPPPAGDRYDQVRRIFLLIFYLICTLTHHSNLAC